jgi:hypothetical protein
LRAERTDACGPVITKLELPAPENVEQLAHEVVSVPDVVLTLAVKLS